MERYGRDVSDAPPFLLFVPTCRSFGEPRCREIVLGGRVIFITRVIRVQSGSRRVARLAARFPDFFRPPITCFASF